MLHMPPLWLWYFDISVILYPKDFIESNSLQYPHVLCSSNICEMLLYLHLVVVTYELIYMLFELLTARGKVVMKQDYMNNPFRVLEMITKKLWGTEHEIYICIPKNGHG